MQDRPSISNTAAEITKEVIDFIHTRGRLLRSELKENLSAWKVALMAVGVALLFLVTAFLFLATTVTTLIALSLSNPFRWALACIFTAVIYGLLGALLAYYATKTFRRAPLTPKKTLDVLRDDKNWLEGRDKAA